MSNQLKELKRATIRLIRQHGAANVSLGDVCREAGIPEGSFAHITKNSFATWMAQAVCAGHYGPPTPIKKGRVDPAVLDAHLITIALDLAERSGYKAVTRAEIAQRAGLHPATVRKSFPTCEGMDSAVMHAARARKNLKVLAQGLALRHPVALRAPDDLKQAAMQWMGAI